MYHNQFHHECDILPQNIIQSCYNAQTISRIMNILHGNLEKCRKILRHTFLSAFQRRKDSLPETKMKTSPQELECVHVASETTLTA